MAAVGREMEMWKMLRCCRGRWWPKVGYEMVMATGWICGDDSGMPRVENGMEMERRWYGGMERRWRDAVCWWRW